MQRRLLLCFAAALPAASFSAAVSGPASGTAGARPLQVVASFSILADMAREVAGDAATVTSLVGTDADAHVYQPKPADVQRIARADLVLSNGLGFEGWIDRLIRASGYKGPVVVLTRGIEPRREGGAPDPHAWQSPRHARRYVENIRAAFLAAAPSQAAAIDRRAAAYLQRIDEIDRRARAEIDTVPPALRRAITPHDAFGYLGEAYGVTFIAPRGWSTDSEASAASLAAVIRQVRSQQARALFLENTTDARTIERIARETGVGIGATLYSDALSAPGTAASSYLGMLSHNTGQLAAALRAGASTLKGRP